jgi:hypothetical protein
LWQNFVTWRQKKNLYDGPLGIKARNFEIFFTMMSNLVVAIQKINEKDLSPSLLR